MGLSLGSHLACLDYDLCRLWIASEVGSCRSMRLCLIQLTPLCRSEHGRWPVGRLLLCPAEGLASRACRQHRGSPIHQACQRWRPEMHATCVTSGVEGMLARDMSQQSGNSRVHVHFPDQQMLLFGDDISNGIVLLHPHCQKYPPRDLDLSFVGMLISRMLIPRH